MMDFLRGLAPRRANDATRATPVLPPRFAGTAPLTAVPAAASSLEPMDNELREPPPQEQAIASASARTRGPLVVPERTDRVDASRVPQEGETTRRDDRHAGTPAVTRAGAHRQRGAAPPASPRPAPAARQNGDSTRANRTHRDDRDREGKAARSEVPAAPDPMARPRRADRSGAVSRPAAVRFPLSEATVAQRASAHAEQRPVIHVTIDRVDVRAAAAPTRPSQSVRTRQRAPHMSLAEYLRGGSGRSGGPA
jgi:hypothetical protein